MSLVLKYGPAVLLAALAVLAVCLLLVPEWPCSFVSVMSVPSGSLITTGNGVSWITPAVIPITAGGLDITVEHVGWNPVDTILYPADTVTVIHLGMIFPIHVSSVPEGANVIIDGVECGITPCDVIASEPGKHSLILFLECGITVTDSICVIRGEEHLYHYDIPFPVSSSAGLPEMILIPDGFYRVGQIHSGRLERFLITRHEVTNIQFADFLNTVDPEAASDSTCLPGRSLLLDEISPCNWYQPITGTADSGYSIREGLGDHPVTGISLAGMEKYCDWLSQIDTRGYSYRLPSEEEWVVAAAGGSDGPYAWGSACPDGQLLNLSDSAESIMCRCPGLTDGFAGTAPVGSFPCNGWGIYDMSGNVWELCDTGIARGGSWFSDSSECRIDAFIKLDSSLGYAFAGFRPAADATQHVPVY